MNTTKSMALLSILIMFLATTFISSCKYEEGPKISLRTKKARVANEWIIEKIEVNGADITTFFLLFGGTSVYKFDKDGDYSGTFAGENLEGTWEFSSSKEELILKQKDVATPTTWKILKLMHKEMWVTFSEENPDTQNTDKYEIHFKPK